MAKIKTIGVIAPASATEENEVDQVNHGLNFLKNLGLEVITAKNIFNRCDHGDSFITAGTLEERLDGFHEIWSNPKVDAVISVRGGYGSMQMLEHIDYSLIKKFSKPLLGYSDLTALHLALNKKCGLQCFHAPMVSRMHSWHADTEKSFVELIERLPGPLTMSDFPSLRFLIEQLNQNKLHAHAGKGGGEAKDFGKLKVLGGNLTLLSGLIGTEYLPDFSNSILFIEEYAEPKYKVDRTLHHLKLAGVFDDVRAIVVGIPTQTVFAYELLEEIASEKNIPLVKDVPIGHCEVNLSLPIG